MLTQIFGIIRNHDFPETRYTCLINVNVEYLPEVISGNVFIVFVFLAWRVAALPECVMAPSRHTKYI